jgi:hypothetical protein
MSENHGALDLGLMEHGKCSLHGIPPSVQSNVGIDDHENSSDPW